MTVNFACNTGVYKDKDGKLFYETEFGIDQVKGFGKNRVYIVVNDKGPKSITFYNKNGTIHRQIDLDHRHLGEQPNVHEGDVPNHQTDFRVKKTKSDLYYISKVERIWKEYINGRNRSE
ncbi:MAG: hypothetical protein Q4A67_03565 [Aerococcus sp.]|nr:hypothetical protein [Aerococcus sp.]